MLLGSFEALICARSAQTDQHSNIIIVISMDIFELSSEMPTYPFLMCRVSL